MISRVNTVAFEGISAKPVEVQCALSMGIPSFQIVGLPDKAVSEARERIRSSISAIGLAMPSKKIIINLSPADMPKIGSHFDLPIALAILAAMGAISKESTDEFIAMGELSLDGTLVPVVGSLSAALTAAELNYNLICPYKCGAEAAWVDSVQVIAAKNLLACIQHFNGQRALMPANPGEVSTQQNMADLHDVKGQEKTKRAMEIAAAGRHHMLLIGEPGSGKSMMAARMPSLLPPLNAHEALETSMIHSIAGLLSDGGISRTPPFRDPHHTASTAAIAGGGRGAKPGEISLAHNGILFMDEFPEFPRTVLETLRQPLEKNEIMVARANAHIAYPCRFLLIAAANPCKCGYMGNPNRACSRVPVCSNEYLGRISGPLLDRFDLRVDVPAVELSDMQNAPKGEYSNDIAKRVYKARTRQEARYKNHNDAFLNSDAEGQILEEIAPLDTEGEALILQAAERFHLSARGYHRVLRVARTVADLDEEENIRAPHIAEAISYRLTL